MCIRIIESFEYIIINLTLKIMITIWKITKIIPYTFNIQNSDMHIYTIQGDFTILTDEKLRS